VKTLDHGNGNKNKITIEAIVLSIILSVNLLFSALPITNENLLDSVVEG